MRVTRQGAEWLAILYLLSAKSDSEDRILTNTIPNVTEAKSSENFCFRIKGTSSQPSITVVRFPYLLKLGMGRGHFGPAGL